MTQSTKNTISFLLIVKGVQIFKPLLKKNVFNKLFSNTQSESVKILHSEWNAIDKIFKYFAQAYNCTASQAKIIAFCRDLIWKFKSFSIGKLNIKIAG